MVEHENRGIDLAADLLEAAAEMVAIETGARAPQTERVYDGAILVEIREAGATTWSLADVSVATSATPDAGSIRAALRQSREGFADLLGVSARVVENWEQGRRTPRGPAVQLLRVAAKHPEALRDVRRSAA